LTRQNHTLAQDVALLKGEVEQLKRRLAKRSGG